MSLMTLENAVMAAVVTQLKGVSGISGISVVQGNADTLIAVPRIAVEATREASAIPGYAVFPVRVEVVVTANAYQQTGTTMTGNAEIEKLFAYVYNSLTGDLTELTNSNVLIHGVRWDGSVSDLRQDRIISRTWSFTLLASPLND